MCEPTSIIMGITAVAGLVANKKAGDAQEELNDRAQVNSLQQWAGQMGEINARQQQEEQATETQQGQFRLEEAQATATAQVQADSSGVGGSTADSYTRDIAEQNRRRIGATDTNLEYTKGQLDYQRQGAGLAVSGRASAMPSIQRPDYLSAGLQIAGAGIEGYGKYQEKNKV